MFYEALESFAYLGIRKVVYGYLREKLRCRYAAGGVSRRQAFF
jgi:hypothetical protein